MSNLVVRAITGAVFVIVVLGSAILGFDSLMILLGGVSLIGTWELIQMVDKSHYSIQKASSIIMSVFLFALGAAVMKDILPVESLGLVIPVYFGTFIAELYRDKRYAIANIALSLMIPVYTTVPYLLLLKATTFDGDYHASIVIGSLILIWSNDTFAYLIGRQIGKTKLFERISPKKTWEGSIGGAIVTLLVGFFILPQFDNSLKAYDWMILGAIAVFFGATGDLVESLMKRTFKVKDSGNILPGHGGVLDRFDALLGAAPFIFTYLVVIKGMLS